MPPEHGYTHLDGVRETSLAPTNDVVETSDVTTTTKILQDVPKSKQITDM